MKKCPYTAVAQANPSTLCSVPITPLAWCRSIYAVFRSHTTSQSIYAVFRSEPIHLRLRRPRIKTCFKNLFLNFSKCLFENAPRIPEYMFLIFFTENKKHAFWDSGNFGFSICKCSVRKHILFGREHDPSVEGISAPTCAS